MKLHIGGTTPKPGWHILNIADGPDVDFVGDCCDLTQFPDGAFNEIYASHVFEHLGHRDGLPQALSECFRTLQPSGTLKISVPDLKILSKLFAIDDLTINQRYEIMLMMYGGQQDDFDFHKVGMFEELLAKYLNHSGFTQIERVEKFNLFEDSSDLQFGGHLISLNIIATK